MMKARWCNTSLHVFLGMPGWKLSTLSSGVRSFAEYSTALHRALGLEGRARLKLAILNAGDTLLVIVGPSSLEYLVT
jgi:hypothetical protein